MSNQIESFLESSLESILTTSEALVLEEGKSIIFISSELTELLAISDRIAIVGNGQIKKIISKNDLIENKNNNVSIEQQLQFLIQTSNMNEALI